MTDPVYVWRAFPEIPGAASYVDAMVEVVCGFVAPRHGIWRWSASKWTGWAMTRSRAVRAVESRITFGKAV